jgi:hypothetical protein
MKFDVLSPFKHDGVLYKIGEVIEEEAEKLAEMIGLGHAKPSNAPVVPTDPAERLAAIRAAIGNLDPANLDLWLKDGKPSADAIVAVTGWPISAAERNDAWTALQALPPVSVPAADPVAPVASE